MEKTGNKLKDLTFIVVGINMDKCKVFPMSLTLIS